MKAKRTIPTVLLVLLVLSVILRSETAVNTRLIDDVLKKEVLDNKDLQIIDDFLAEAVQTLVKTRDFTSIAKIRTVITSRRSTQGQYAQQFSESSYKYISSGLRQAEELPEERKFRVILNLLILADSLEDPRLIDLAIAKLKDNNKVIRYWAVRCVTNPALLKKLNPNEGANLRLLQRIAEQLKELVDSSEPEILALIAEFTAQTRIPEGEDLLGQIADIRIKRYADWTVKYELLDISVLRLLYDRIAPDQVGRSSKPAGAFRFAQLYSYAMQRYIKGRDFLSDNSKHYLASVLVETEDKCIGKLLGRPQSTIKRAVEQSDDSLLSQEYNRLFGDQRGAGELTLKLNIDYGTDPSGKKRMAPLTLPGPPKTSGS